MKKQIKTQKNIKKIALAVFGVLAAGLIGTSALVTAYQGDPTKQGPDYNADLHDLKVDAFNAVDYAVWKDLMEQSGNSGRVLDVVNEDNFGTFAEAHSAALAGDMDRSNELRAQLGLNNGVGPKDGSGYKGANGARAGMSGKGTGQGSQGAGQGGRNALGDGTGLRDGSCLVE